MGFEVYRAEIVDLWQRQLNVCITVSLELRGKELNGVVDRGNARALAEHIPALASKLGRCILKGKGNVDFVQDKVIAFFTKPKSCKFERCLPDVVDRYRWDQQIPGGHCMADPVLVERSARQLLRLVIRERLELVYLPLPGVQNGRLDVAEIGDALKVLKNSSSVRLIANRDIDDPNIEMRDLED
ncbi:MAG: hypothetical protein LBI74_01300 [Synergistaceae bacterium]|jgi:hypothetical protein|nr:hypothetical protein [Synergistaceae bacterium]